MHWFFLLVCVCACTCTCVSSRSISNKVNILELARLLRVKVFMNLLRDGNMHCSQCVILTATLERIFDYIISFILIEC